MGRNPDCGIVIPVTSVSREHAQILRIGGKYYIEDKQSRNGTFVNNQAINTRTALKNNDRIRLCDFIAAFLDQPGNAGQHDESNDLEEFGEQDLTFSVMLAPPGPTMTEAQWLACADAETMLAFLDTRVSDRKFRLFGCACCRRIWHLILTPPGRAAVEASERY